MKWWTMLDSVGLMAYRERKANKSTRGTVHVCFTAKCLQRRRRDGAFLRLENFFCPLDCRAWSLGDVVDEESDERMLARPVPRLGPVSPARMSWPRPPDFLRRGDVLFPVAGCNWSAEVLRSGDGPGAAIVAGSRYGTLQLSWPETGQ